MLERKLETLLAYRLPAPTPCVKTKVNLADSSLHGGSSEQRMLTVHLPSSGEINSDFIQGLAPLEQEGRDEVSTSDLHGISHQCDSASDLHGQDAVSHPSHS